MSRHIVVAYDVVNARRNAHLFRLTPKVSFSSLSPCIPVSAHMMNRQFKEPLRMTLLYENDRKHLPYPERCIYYYPALHHHSCGSVGKALTVQQ